MTRHQTRSLGFTIIELVTVMSMIGILGSIVVPQFGKAIARADAARIVTDISIIRGAALAYEQETGSFPGDGSWGVVPTAFVQYLPDGFDFTYKDVSYRWRRGRPRGVLAGMWGAVYVRYPRRSKIAQAMQTHRSSYVLWRAASTIFLFPR